MNDSLSIAHALLFELYMDKRDYDKAIAEGERGVALNPGGMSELLDYASLSYAGRRKEALQLFHKAIRNNPCNPHFY